jgi:hypothetical protein
MLHIHLGTEYDLKSNIVAVRYFATAALGAAWIKHGPVMKEGKKKYPLRFVSETTIPVCETVGEATHP